ncbi:MAG: ABC transporter ATP-binding protein [Clostridiales bacterium]|nr:ABC transporter ATP-binding protein [Clostridiales bacterium]
MKKRNGRLVKKSIKVLFPRVALTTLMNVVNACVAFLVQIWLLKYILNSVGKHSFSHILLVLAIVFVIRLIISSINAYLNTTLYPCMDNSIRKSFQSYVFDFTAKSDIELYDNQEFFDRMHRVVFQSNERIIGLVNIYGNLIYSTVSLLLIGLYLFKASIILLVMIIVPVVINVLIGRIKNRRNYQKSLELTGETRKSEYFKRVIYQKKHAKDVRVTNIVGVVRKMLSGSIDQSISITKNYSSTNVFLDVTKKAVNSIAINIGIVLYVAYKSMVEDSINGTDVIVMIRAIWQLNENSSRMADNILQLHEQSLYIRDVKMFLNLRPSINISDKKDQKEISRFNNDIVFENVSFKYRNSKENVLKNVDLRIGKGQKIALVGTNGSGKTTLVKLLLRLYDPSEGVIKIDGEDIKNINYLNYRQLFGVELQAYRLFAISFKENIYIDKTPHNEQDLCNAIGIGGIIQRSSHGFETNVTKEFDETGENLSGGEEQKIALARAYAKEADIMVLDEPSSALDPIAENEMFKSMMEICKDKTLIMISHRLSSVLDSDCIFMLENGEIVEMGTHDELMNMSGKYSELFDVQAKSYIEGLKV